MIHLAVFIAARALMAAAGPDPAMGQTRATQPVQRVDAASRAAILTAQQAQARQRAYSVGLTTTTSTQTDTGRLVFVAPDRYHYRDINTRLLTELVRVGKEDWHRDSGGSWQAGSLASTRMFREFQSPPGVDAEGYRVTEARTLPSVEVNGITSTTYQYVVAKDDETWNVTMWVSPPLNLPAKYRASLDRGGDRSTQHWEIVYDATLTVPNPAAEVVCRTGAACLELGEAFAREVPERAADFYDRACKAGTWQGCLGYASRLIGQALETENTAERARLAGQAVALLDGVIKAEPKVWRAYAYKGVALRVTLGFDAKRLEESRAIQARAQAVQREFGSDPVNAWNALLWPRDK